MSKKKLSLIMLTVASLVMCAVLAGGVIFAWMASNQKVTGGISVGVMESGDIGVILTAFNDDTVPDDNYNVYPGDQMALRLRATRTITGFSVMLTNDKLTDSNFESRFGARPDLLLGQYEKETSLNAGAASVVDHYDIEAHLDTYKKPGDIPLTDPEKLDAKVDFLKKFTDDNSMLSTMTVKLVGIRAAAGYTEEDYSSDPVILSAGSIAGGQTQFSLPSWIPITHPLTYMSTCFTVDFGQMQTIDGVQCVRVTDFSLPTDKSIDIVVEYGGTNYQPYMNIAAGDSLVTGYGFGVGKYYTRSYNCFSFQRMTIGFTTD